MQAAVLPLGARVLPAHRDDVASGEAMHPEAVARDP